MSTIKVRLWRVAGSDKSYLWSTVPKDKHREGRTLYIAKSITEHISTLKPQEANEWQECEVTLPEWLVEKENL